MKTYPKKYPFLKSSLECTPAGCAKFRAAHPSLEAEPPVAAPAGRSPNRGKRPMAASESSPESSPAKAKQPRQRAAERSPPERSPPKTPQPRQTPISPNSFFSRAASSARSVFGRGYSS